MAVDKKATSFMNDSFLNHPLHDSCQSNESFLQPIDVSINLNSNGLWRLKPLCLNRDQKKVIENKLDHFIKCNWLYRQSSLFERSLGIHCPWDSKWKNRWVKLTKSYIRLPSDTPFLHTLFQYYDYKIQWKPLNVITG
jgi:hypothetical protein